ncbi:glycoside hydrolase family 16 protein [Virgibacillus oceani]|uniref:GH16 domain-containing protein n=1 Tax=Virgibacillus oceani TaxID=1479511 RepID=A0A917H9T5_9BACI|nr:glycoside hydrolase family 16 protein [Virgibacillus oceani]GGG72269.1 hypothetical protein GCM10011398_15770 [Virgibacillus oceani]
MKWYGVILLITVSISSFYLLQRSDMGFISSADSKKLSSKVTMSEKREASTFKQTLNLPNESYYNPKKKQWKLVWQDEFDGTQLHRSKWNIEDWAAEKNKELEYYTPKNVMLKDGKLKLVSLKEKHGDREYTSGAIHSKDKFSLLYGKVEMRAKLPRGQGIFPAFWMLTDKETTYLPEIDIMEMLGHRPEETWMVLHWLDENHQLNSVSKSYIGDDYSDDFHTFGIEWTEDSITWFVDGIERFHTEQYIPHEEMYLYVNTAIGGVWPGNPDKTTSFPQYYLVDYIRVYKQNGGVG